MDCSHNGVEGAAEIDQGLGGGEWSFYHIRTDMLTGCLQCRRDGLCSSPSLQGQCVDAYFVCRCQMVTS